MIEHTAGVPTGHGTMKTFVIHPEEGGPFAPIVLFMDIWGESTHLKGARR